MAQTLIGQAVVWGADNFRVTGTGVVVGVAEGHPQSWSGTRDADITDLKDANGETIGRNFSAKKKAITITVMPASYVADKSKTTAKANLDLFLLAPSTTITLTDSDAAGTVWEAAHSAKWYLNTSRVRRTNNTPAMIEMDIVQYDDYDITVATT